MNFTNSSIEKINILCQKLWLLGKSDTLRSDFYSLIKNMRPSEGEISTWIERSTPSLRGFFLLSTRPVEYLLFHAIRDPLAKSFHLLNSFFESGNMEETNSSDLGVAMAQSLARVCFYLENGYKILDEVMSLRGNDQKHISPEIRIFAEEVLKALEEIRIQIPAVLKEMGCTNYHFDIELAELRKNIPHDVIGIETIAAINLAPV